MDEAVTEYALTPAQIEGPYWKPGSPQRMSMLEPDTKGERIVVSGTVRNAAGKPIADAWIDFWQCDGQAFYDNKGFRLRGHQFTDADGRYLLETVVPSEYDDFLVSPDGDKRMVYRTSHIHVKVKAPERQTLTTQLYVPGAPGNIKDSYYTQACELEIEDAPTGKRAHFDFVVR
jgi:protocatechuate 3,4-dioxygenase beta subunit